MTVAAHDVRPRLTPETLAKMFQGGFSDELVESLAWKKYVLSNNGKYVFGYIGEHGRSKRRDQFFAGFY